MFTEADRYLLRSAQHALLGHITPVVRSMSFEIDGKTIMARAVFEREPSEEERELISLAWTYVIADYRDELLHEQYLVSTGSLDTLNLRLVAYQRYEPDPNYPVV